MTDSFDIVCCSLEDWDDVWRRNQYLVRELFALEPNCRVLFVEPPNDVVHELRRGRPTKPRTTLRPIDGMPNLWALKPTKVLPRVAGGGADRLLASQVERAARRLGFTRPLLWINDASYATLAARVSWPCLYDITDDWLLAAAAPRELRRREQREHFLLERADEVVVCSPALAAGRGQIRSVRTVTNAVDQARYREPAARPDDLPPDPVAVYVGTLHRDRLDIDLVVRAADAAPGLQFAFVGPLSLDASDLNAMRAKANIHLLGARPWDAVPAYMQHASVLMVPHVASPFTESLDPLKAYEYLAAGRPVVATSVAGFRDIRLPQVSCVDYEHFAEALLAAAESDTNYRVPDLPSWRERAVAFRDALVEARSGAARRRLRVVYLDHSAELSGAELALARLLPALTEVDPTVILAEAGPLQARLEGDGVATEVLALSPKTQSLRRDNVAPGRLPLAVMWESARYVFALRRRLRELQPDIVHTNSLKAAMYGSIAGRLANVPVVVHVHDRIASDYLPRPAVVAVRTVLRRVPVVLIANSAATLATVAPRAHRDRPTTTVIHYAVRPPAVLAHPPNDAPFCVGMVGRLAPWKGQDVFLEAFASVFAHTEVRARIVGSAMFGEADYEANLRLLAEQLDVSDQIEFVGFVDDVYPQLALMDVLVHASVIAEPFGQVIIEAMAAGVPVIASAAGGPLEFVENDVSGLLVPPGDATALSEALRALHDDPGLRRRLAKAASEGVSRFDPAAIANEVQAVYEAVLGHVRPKSVTRNAPIDQ